MNIFEKDQTYIAHTYGRNPVAIVSGKGALLKDADGKEYIDLGSGIAVNTFGAADEEWAAAVTAQLNSLQHISNLYYTAPCAQLAEMLCTRTGMKKVFFSNSGAESNECAIKAARRWACLKHGDMEHSNIITLKNSFHGRTITTLAATGQDGFHTDFGPFPEGFVYASPTDASEVRAYAEKGNCAAVMIEMVQGEGGVYPLEQAYVDEIVNIVNEFDMLLIVDEVQTGNGRTGDLYAYMGYGIKPDIVTTAKGLGGGLPIGATMLGEKVQDIYVPGTHGSTFGGNPVACAGAVSILSRIDEALLGEVKAKHDYIVGELTGAKGVNGISGKGLMLGIETVKPAKEVIAQCMAKGVLVLSAKTKVRLLPPLNIDMEQFKKAVAVLKAVLADI